MRHKKIILAGGTGFIGQGLLKNPAEYYFDLATQKISFVLSQFVYWIVLHHE